MGPVPGPLRAWEDMRRPSKSFYLCARAGEKQSAKWANACRSQTLSHFDYVPCSRRAATSGSARPNPTREIAWRRIGSIVEGGYMSLTLFGYGQCYRAGRSVGRRDVGVLVMQVHPNSL